MDAKLYLKNSHEKTNGLRLYLRDVSTIDERGRALLRKLVEKGVGLQASGIYSSYIVDEIQSPRLNGQHSRG
jgi:hypothetical protein